MIAEKQQIEQWTHLEPKIEFQEKWYENIRLYFNLEDLYQKLLDSWVDCHLPQKKYDPYICRWTGYQTLYKIPQLNLSFEQHYFVFFTGIENDFRVLFKDRPLNFFVSWNSLYYIDRAMVVSWDKLLWGDWTEPFPLPLQDQNFAKNWWEKVLEVNYFSWNIQETIKEIEDNLIKELNTLYGNPMFYKNTSYSIPTILFSKNDMDTFWYELWIDFQKDWLDCYFAWKYMVCFKLGFNYYYLIYMPGRNYVPQQDLSPLKNLKLFDETA